MLIYYYSFERYIRAILFANDMLLSFNSCECNKSFYHVSQTKKSAKSNLILFICKAIFCLGGYKRMMVILHQFLM